MAAETVGTAGTAGPIERSGLLERPRPLAAPPMPAMVKPPVNKWLVTLAVGMGSLMAAIDTSIVNVAMPHIRGSVGATVQEITWVSTAYIIATVLVLSGFLGALIGQKRLLPLLFFLRVKRTAEPVHVELSME